MKYFEFRKENETLMVMLHGGLIAEHTEQFIEEVKAVYAASVAKKEVTYEEAIF